MKTLSLCLLVAGRHKQHYSVILQETNANGAELRWEIKSSRSACEKHWTADHLV